jgi:hypothetical protein
MFDTLRSMLHTATIAAHEHAVSLRSQVRAIPGLGQTDICTQEQPNQRNKSFDFAGTRVEYQRCVACS